MNYKQTKKVTIERFFTIQIGSFVELLYTCMNLLLDSYLSRSLSMPEVRMMYVVWILFGMKTATVGVNSRDYETSSAYGTFFNFDGIASVRN